MRDDVRMLLGLADPINPLTRERVRALLDACPDAVVAPLPELAARHRVDGFIGARLNALPTDATPAELREPFVRALHRHKLRALGALRERDRILEAFAGNNIDCIVLKGADLAFRIYADPGARPFEDLDLLVHEDDVDTTCEVLRNLDYEIPRDLLPSSLIRKVHFHLPFLHRDGRAFVEIHWQLVDRQTLSPDTLDDVWSGSTTCPEGWRILEPATYAAYLAVHLSKHGVLNPHIATHPRALEILLHPWADCRLIWFIDLWQLAERHSLEPADILEAAEKMGCNAQAEQALRFVVKLFPACPWNLPAAPAPEKQGRISQSITDRLLRRILADLDQDIPAAGDSPWLLTTNKRLHIRPIRMFTRRKSNV